MIPANLLAYPPMRAAERSGNFPEVGKNLWRTVMKGLDLDEQRDRYNQYREMRHQKNGITQERMHLHATRYGSLIQAPRRFPEP